MLDFDFDRMLFTIPTMAHSDKEIAQILHAHPEVRFISLTGQDIGGHDTDEKIPTEFFLKNIETFLTAGVQTDGSSVVLPKIAELNNAKVSIVPDSDVNWYVDHNLQHIDRETGLPVGTLRIPSFLVHNDVNQVGSRAILRDALTGFTQDIEALLKQHPYVFKYLEAETHEEIERLEITAATELEFWVKTPEDEVNREQLTTSQMLKEQYWKRTDGPVRTALEETMLLLDRYGLEMEMGHKEVGGVKAKIGNDAGFDHVMEQLEIDWKYSNALQTADNEKHIKYIVRDVFRMYGLEVTFMAKPIEGVSGNGEHTHMGLAADTKDGGRINLFTPRNIKEDFLSPIGYGALMGILKNYQLVNPFVSATNDAFNRLKPGYEAPVCVVTSLGHDVDLPTRNRTVLIGLVRDQANSLATRFELRSPNPKSNTYLVLAASCMAMLDGIKAALSSGKTPKELQESISKDYGQEDFYLEKNRLYRSEGDVYREYSEKERKNLFGSVPRTVWENICAFDQGAKGLRIFKKRDVMTARTLSSYKCAIIEQWALELQKRIIPDTMELIRTCSKCHDEINPVDYDVYYWTKINAIREYLGRDTLNAQCLLSRIIEALNKQEYQIASDLQIEMQEKVKELTELYVTYKKNLF